MFPSWGIRVQQPSFYSEENFTKPWKNLFNGREQYYLKYESSYLLELGKAMDYIVKGVATFATQEALKYTVLSGKFFFPLFTSIETKKSHLLYVIFLGCVGLVAAIAWPAWLLSAASVIDNPWGVCLRRSAQVGKQLAESLLSRNQGHRPVTLVGYSLGARVIFFCLKVIISILLTSGHGFGFRFELIFPISNRKCQRGKIARVSYRT